MAEVATPTNKILSSPRLIGFIISILCCIILALIAGVLVAVTTTKSVEKELDESSEDAALYGAVVAGHDDDVWNTNPGSSPLQEPDEMSAMYSDGPYDMATTGMSTVARIRRSGVLRCGIPKDIGSTWTWGLSSQNVTIAFYDKFVRHHFLPPCRASNMVSLVRRYTHTNLFHCHFVCILLSAMRLLRLLLDYIMLRMS